MSSGIDILGLLGGQAFNAEDGKFRQQSLGAPLNPYTQMLVQQMNQQEPDYAAELQSAMERFPDPKMGFAENFAQALAKMPFQAPRGGGDAFLQGLARGFSGTTINKYGQEQEKKEKLRGAASEMAKSRWEKVLKSKEEAETGLRQFGAQSEMERIRQGGKEDLLTKRADLAMLRTQASIAAANERARSAAELALARVTNQGKNFDVQNVFRINNQIKVHPDINKFREVRAAYADGITAAKAENSVGDLVLMRMLAKATDPSTGVREGEYATFEDAQGSLAKRGVQVSKGWWGGGKLTPFGRKQMLAMLENRYRNSEAANKKVMGHFKRVADSTGVPWDLVEHDIGLSEQGPPPGATIIRIDEKGNVVSDGR